MRRNRRASGECEKAMSDGFQPEFLELHCYQFTAARGRDDLAILEIADQTACGFRQAGGQRQPQNESLCCRCFVWGGDPKRLKALPGITCIKLEFPILIRRQPRTFGGQLGWQCGHDGSRSFVG